MSETNSSAAVLKQAVATNGTVKKVATEVILTVHKDPNVLDLRVTSRLSGVSDDHKFVLEEGKAIATDVRGRVSPEKVTPSGYRKAKKFAKSVLKIEGVASVVVGPYVVVVTQHSGVNRFVVGAALLSLIASETGSSIDDLELTKKRSALTPGLRVGTLGAFFLTT